MKHNRREGIRSWGHEEKEEEEEGGRNLQAVKCSQLVNSLCSDSVQTYATFIVQSLMVVAMELLWQ